VAGRIHIETDDIIKFGGEVRIVGSLEGLDPVRLELVSDPYALDVNGAANFLKSGAAKFPSPAGLGDQPLA
jgi:hypothetical protein